MASAQRIAPGFPFPIYINETAAKQRIAPGVYVNEKISGGGTTFNQSVLAACSPIASLARQTVKLMLASCSPAAALVKQTGKPLAASSPPVASLVRTDNKPLQATTAPVGTLSELKVHLTSLQASTAPVASLVRSTGKLLQASSAPVAVIVRQMAKLLQAVTAPISSLARQTAKALQATSSPLATLTAIKVHLTNLQASASATASMVRNIGKPLQAVTSPVGALSRAIAKALKAVASAAASLATQFHSGGGGPPLSALPPYVALMKQVNYVALQILAYTALVPRANWTSLAIGNNMPATKDFPPIDAITQKQTVAFDFGLPLPAGIVLTGTPTITVSVHEGTDATPAARVTSGPQIGTQPLLQGGSGITNAAVLVQLGTMLGGVTYLVQCACNATNGDVMSGWCHVRCLTPN